MKKIFIICFLLVSFTNYASTLVIENTCQGTLRILHMRATLGNNHYDYFYPNNNPNYCQINSMDVLEISDITALNRQFPFLDVFPFSGNVRDTNGNVATLPLPTTIDNSPIPTTRFQLASMRFQVDGDWATGFSLPYDYVGNYVATEIFTAPFVYNGIPGNPSYYADYMRFSSIYYISFYE